MSTGVFSYSHTDMFIPGRGVPTEFTRQYNAMFSGSGGLGARWTHNYEMRLEELEEAAFITYPGGGKALFRLQFGSYIAPIGNHDILEDNGDGTFTLTTKDQVKYTLGADGRLAMIADRNANETVLTYDGTGLDRVTDPSGRYLDFTNDGTGRIVKIEDKKADGTPLVEGGRSVEYAYDGMTGDLVEVTDVKGGKATFTYQDHLLETLTDSRAMELPVQDRYAAMTNVYDTYNRVVRQTDGEGNVSCVFYGVGPPNAECGDVVTPTPPQVAGETIFDDPRRNQTTYRHDGSFRTIEIEDARAGLATFRYEDPADLPETHCSENAAVDRNLCEVTDQGDGAARHDTRFRYDDRGNLARLTDAQGNVWRYE